MTPQNMQEAREILNAWNWNPSPELGPEGIRLQELIALALSKAEARGRLVGLEEVAKDKENRIHDLELKLAGLYGYADIQGMEFVKHIKAHLKDGQEVICKICGKTVEQIALEAVE